MRMISNYKINVNSIDYKLNLFYCFYKLISRLNKNIYSEQLEICNLAQYATKSINSLGRKHAEKVDENRTCFQVDRDRIFFSKSFRKLQFKTQVFSSREGHLIRNRYIHSLQVALHSRTIARIIRVNEDLCEAIAYAHDIGHPPFGHAGETEINTLALEKGNIEFEHNTQSLRVVDYIEKRNGKKGLNLCFETAEGIIRHQTISDNPKNIPKQYIKYNSPSIESQIVNVADEIAFSIHDLYDAFQSKILTIQKQKELEMLPIWKKSGGNLGQMTHLLINDVRDHTRKNLKEIKDLVSLRSRDLVCNFSSEVENEVRQLQSYLIENVYNSAGVKEMDQKGKIIIRDLFMAFWNKPSLIFHKTNSLRINNRDKTIAVIDFISGLTDIEALNMHNKLLGP